MRPTRLPPSLLSIFKIDPGTGMNLFLNLFRAARTNFSLCLFRAGRFFCQKYMNALHILEPQNGGHRCQGPGGTPP